MIFSCILVIVCAGVVSFAMGRARARSCAAYDQRLHSLPVYHGAFVCFATVLPMLAVWGVWFFATPHVVETAALAHLPPDLYPVDGLARDSRIRDILNLLSGISFGNIDERIKDAAVAYGRYFALSNWLGLMCGAVAGTAGLLLSLRAIRPAFRARNRVENVVKAFLIACSVLAVLTTAGIVLSVVFETARFFARYPWNEFLFGLQWSPQTAIRAGQGGSSGAFGIVPLFAGTLLITAIAMVVAVPIGLLCAIYMAEYASSRFRAIAKPLLEILAGVPTVVFGFFAAITMAPAVRRIGEAIGLNVSSESALAAGVVMGIMIIPFVSSLSDDVINAVPQALRDGSYAMGATKSETVKRVVLPAALPGIVSAIMLAISRAVGETMIVVMAAGLAANLTLNPLETVTTFTVQIKTILVGDQEFDSVKTLSAFALGFVLFFFTLMLNVIALRIVRKYRQAYD
jgi:phosphate transport system permease protein